MHFKTILAISLFSAAPVVYASPPGCLLAAVNTQPEPSDYKTICGVKASDVQREIHRVCKGDDTAAALSSFADTCNSNVVTASSVSSQYSDSGSASGTGKEATFATVTGTGSMATGVTSGGTTKGSSFGNSGSSGSSGNVTAFGTAKPSTNRTSGAHGYTVGSAAGLIVAVACVVFIL